MPSLPQRLIAQTIYESNEKVVENMNQLPPGHISLIDDQSKKLLPLFLITQHNLNKESIMFKHYPLRQHTYFILLKVSLNQEGGSVIPSLLK